MLRDRRVGLLLIASAGFVSLLGASPQATLNPLVVRNPRPVTAVPAECEQGLTAAPTPRIEVAQIPLPEPPARQASAPPSGTLRTALHEAQDALTRNDRPAFDENRTRARALLAAYPAGEERRVAEDVSRLHETAARLWDAQYESPFFGTDSAEYTVVSRLPGYQEAVRRSTLTDDDDRRFYPAAESREFVARAAADRLRRLGIRSATPPTRTARVEPRSTSRSREPRPRITQTQTHRSTASTSAKPRHTTPRRTTTTTAAATKTNTRKPAPVTPVPSSPNPSVPPTTAAVPAPAAPHGTTPPAAGGLPTPVPTAMTADTATTATVPDTAFDTPPTTTTETTSAPITIPDTAAVTTDTTDTTDTTPIPAPPPTTRGRSVILPVILILIGLGVLIVLFRASK